MGTLTYHPPHLPALEIEVVGRRVQELCWLPHQPPREKRCHWSADRREEGSLLRQLARDLEGYFSGKPVQWQWPLNWSQGTSFQRQVWRTLCQIPYGETRSYQWLATQVGRPRGMRAVGQANKRNPFPLIAPCHRIIHADGRLGGYASGTRIKTRLLELEGAR